MWHKLVPLIVDGLEPKDQCQMALVSKSIFEEMISTSRLIHAVVKVDDAALLHRIYDHWYNLDSDSMALYKRRLPHLTAWAVKYDRPDWLKPDRRPSKGSIIRAGAERCFDKLLQTWSRIVWEDLPCFELGDATVNRMVRKLVAKVKIIDSIEYIPCLLPQMTDDNFLMAMQIAGIPTETDLLWASLLDGGFFRSLEWLEQHDAGVENCSNFNDLVYTVAKNDSVKGLEFIEPYIDLSDWDWAHVFVMFGAIDCIRMYEEDFDFESMEDNVMLIEAKDSYATCEIVLNYVDTLNLNEIDALGALQYLIEAGFEEFQDVLTAKLPNELNVNSQGVHRCRRKCWRGGCEHGEMVHLITEMVKALEEEESVQGFLRIIGNDVQLLDAVRPLLARTPFEEITTCQSPGFMFETFLPQWSFVRAVPTDNAVWDRTMALRRELLALGLTRRIDSRLCDAFETGGETKKTAGEVAEIMAQQRYLYEYRNLVDHANVTWSEINRDGEYNSSERQEHFMGIEYDLRQEGFPSVWPWLKYNELSHI